jgi:cytochrome oxidase assembly protein ShyY1
MARLEDRVVKPPLLLPPKVDPTAIDGFDYRRVLATGGFRHDHEMLVGPRIRDGGNGFQIVTPLERPGGEKILVNCGWISKKMKDHKNRDRDALPTGEVAVEGLLRSLGRRICSPPTFGRISVSSTSRTTADGRARQRAAGVGGGDYGFALASLQFYIFFLSFLAASRRRH